MTRQEHPGWLERNCPVSFSYKPAGTNHDVFGCQILRSGLITHVSLLSPAQQPAEPLAKLMTLREQEPAGEVVYGGRVIRRNVGRILALR